LKLLLLLLLLQLIIAHGHTINHRRNMTS